MRPFYRKPLGWLTISAFIFLILPFQMFSQAETGGMMGVVYKKDVKTPFKKCRVALITIVKDKKKEKIYKSEPTDDEGKYEITNIPPGIYKVGIITKSGKKPSKTLTVVNIVGGQILDRSFYYKPRKPLLGYLNCFIAVIFFGIILII